MAAPHVYRTTNGQLSTPGPLRTGPETTPRSRRWTSTVPRTPRTRAGATWVGICLAALLLVALIVFMFQNTQPVLVSFLGTQATVPLALALLVAGVGVGVIALVVGTVRIGQLRRRLAHGG
ncbi:LapA family protein [Isoptericola halotolerans]|uniref:Integral membrane protein n=1 Tax=Isoptericola halotolerans TaxID=300560 RepID=A0ABX2A2P3_9MICO|nr:lipopolysaccharide assembly protein LapA domain-containing protein [Isoptericola halotolerans]NOV95878.1 putative integral membrane protein [Isoptericola halotolerans]